MDMIEKMAEILRIEPYFFFINRSKQNDGDVTVNNYPKLPFSMKNEINNEINLSISNVIKEILNKY
jgi:hypothetical protein